MHRKLFRRYWRRLPAIVFGFGILGGCAADDYSDYSLRPAWVQNQEFHLETRYQSIGMKTERGDASADPASDNLNDTVDLGSQWGEAVYWRYQVIRSNFVPDENDDFFEYAVKGGTESPLTVIKASLDPVMNIDNELTGADPKVYLVIREDRLRMAGLVYFYTANGERLSEAVTVDDEAMNRSYSLLSQSNLAIIPHFIPPFPIAPENREMVLENGETVTFTNATEDGVDVIYGNAIDNTDIAETWEHGQPWATMSITPTVESRLLSESEVDDLSGGMAGTFDNHEDPEDFDFIDLLKAAVNLDEALNINGMLGNSSFEVREGYRPWAGSWWRQSEGALMLGYHTEAVGGTGAFPETVSANDTLSELQIEVFKTPATALQNLGEEMRTLRKNGNADGEEYNTKRDEYRETQSEFVTELSTFYNSVRAAIDGGRIRIEEGRLKAEENWNANDDSPYPAFNYGINDMSPLDKFALLQQKNGRTHGTNPWFGPAWEMLNHWSPAGSAWWGHCNGWAAAAILTHEPREAVTVQFGDINQYEMELTAADQKGLLSESFYSQLSSFYGARYNGDEDDDISDLSPKAIVQLLSTYIGERGVPLVFDTSANEQVWNYPAWGYELELTETTEGGAAAASGLININTAGIVELSTLWGISTVRAQRIISYREQHGAFQTTEEIIDVRGIGRGIFNRITDLITVNQDTELRSFRGELNVRFATDGVSYTHIDADINAPNGFVKNYQFTLEASPAGEVLSSLWAEEDSHPDFAWVPYTNTVRSGNSENNYLEWIDLKGYIPNVLRD
jgi:competence ComEA-like helix-hairpin-helix protein